MLRTIVHTLFLGCLLSTLLLNCVTPYQPDPRSIPRALVVDGLLTDAPGPHTVALTYTADYTQSSINLRVSNARVTLTDDRGVTQGLAELSAGSGTYRTPANFRGQVGRTYRLTIITADGKRYESAPERLRPVSPIDSVYWEYTEKPIAGTLGFDKGFDVYLDTRDPATPGDYYRWRWTHYTPIAICAIRAVPNSNPVVEYSYPCCSPCWDIVRCFGSRCLNLATDALINGNAVSRQPILRVPFTSTSRFYVEIEQLSLSPAAYTFWNSVDKLTNQNGGIFDAAPATIRGNMRCITDPNEPVFGFFGASAVSLRPVYVNRSITGATPTILPPPPPFPPGPPPPCTVCEENAFRTPNKPRFWID